MPRAFSEKEKARIVRWYEGGDSIDLIAWKIGCDKKPVSKTLHEAKVNVRKRTHRQNVAWAWRGKK